MNKLEPIRKQTATKHHKITTLKCKGSVYLYLQPTCKELIT